MSGYFGFGNLGDEAIFEAMVSSLRQEAPEVELVALTADPTRAQQLGVRAIPRKHLPSIISALRGCDLFLSGGGGLVQDSTGVGSVIYYLGLCQLARLFGKPTMFFAQGFGPVRTGLGQRICRWFSKSISLITLRDQESWQDMKTAGFAGQSCYVTADPALLLQPPSPTEMNAILRQHGLTQELGRLEGPMGRFSESGPLVALTVRPWIGLPKAELFEGLARFQEAQKARYLIIPFHPHQDAGLSEELKAYLRGPCQVIGADWSPSQTTGLLRCCDLIVGMRLHSLILAAGATIPSLGLCYDPKVTRFVRRCGAVPMQLDEITAHSLSTNLERLLSGRSAARAQMKERVAAMQNQAQATAKAAILLAKGQSSNLSDVLGSPLN